jgi:hypothetical protein
MSLNCGTMKTSIASMISPTNPSTTMGYVIADLMR